MNNLNIEIIYMPCCPGTDAAWENLHYSLGCMRTHVLHMCCTCGRGATRAETDTINLLNYHESGRDKEITGAFNVRLIKCDNCGLHRHIQSAWESGHEPLQAAEPKRVCMYRIKGCGCFYPQPTIAVQLFEWQHNSSYRNVNVSHSMFLLRFPAHLCLQCLFLIGQLLKRPDRPLWRLTHLRQTE